MVDVKVEIKREILVENNVVVYVKVEREEIKKEILVDNVVGWVYEVDQVLVYVKE